MAFFDYRQNNSGGGFNFDADAGISVHVIVEADSANEANERAESIGLYFDGGGDCPCCGDRWYSQWSTADGDPVPSLYGTPVWDVDFDSPNRIRWVGDSPEAFVHYKSGYVAAYGGK